MGLGKGDHRQHLKAYRRHVALKEAHEVVDGDERRTHRGLIESTHTSLCRCGIADALAAPEARFIP